MCIDGVLRGMIVYNEEKKDLPSARLHELFVEAGWSDGNEPEWMKENFNAPFVHSTLVVSAWEGEKMVGCVRVLSDTVTRSVIYDLVVDRAFRAQGIGSELLRRCMAKYPQSEWLLQTQESIAPFYEKNGFSRFEEPVMFRKMAWREGGGE